MLLFTFERFKSHETVYRRESVKLWEGLVTESPPSANPSNPKVRLPNDFKGWIRECYCPVRKDRSILRQLQEIDFSRNSSSMEISQEQRQEESSRRAKLVAQQR